jgi:hypothetical protein
MVSDAVLIKLIDNVPLALTAIGTTLAAWQTYRNGKKGEIAIQQNTRIEKQNDAIHEKATTAILQNEKIAVQTDGNLTALRDQLAALAKTTETQEHTIQVLTQTVDKLAEKVKASERQVRASDKRDRYTDKR